MTIDKGGYQSSSLINRLAPHNSTIPTIRVWEGAAHQMIREANQGNQDYISLDNCASRKLIGGCSTEVVSRVLPTISSSRKASFYSLRGRWKLVRAETEGWESLYIYPLFPPFFLHLFSILLRISLNHHLSIVKPPSLTLKQSSLLSVSVSEIQ